MDTIKVIGSDYIGWQVGSSVVKMKPEFKDSALKVTINSVIYRLILKGQLPSSFLNMFNSIKDEYFKQMIIDFVSLAIINIISLNMMGDKKSYSKTVIKSAIQSFVSTWTHSMIK